MTLIVVDEQCMVADSYATVCDHRGVKVMDGFPKLFTLPFRFDLHDGTHSYPRLAFSGNAEAFHTFLVWLHQIGAGRTVLPLELLISNKRLRGGRIVQVIVPIAQGAFTVSYGGNFRTEVQFHKGRVLGFGGDYTPPAVGLTETRDWQTIFRETIARGGLPGDEYHLLWHQPLGNQFGPSRGRFNMPTNWL